MTNTILAIDASTEALSIALTHQGQQYCFFDVCPQQHSQRILTEIDTLLAKANCALKEVDVIGYCEGPGSFTGVRISVSVAQGLAFSAQKPVVGISSLAMMAQQAIEQRGVNQVVSAIDARMGELYVGAFENINGLATLVGTQQVVKPEALAVPFDAALAVGTGWQSYPDLAHSVAGISIDEHITLPNSQFMLALVAEQFAQGQQHSASEAQPVYVRDTVTWKKLPGRE